MHYVWLYYHASLLLYCLHWGWAYLWEVLSDYDLVGRGGRSNELSLFTSLFFEDPDRGMDWVFLLLPWSVLVNSVVVFLHCYLSSSVVLHSPLKLCALDWWNSYSFLMV